MTAPRVPAPPGPQAPGAVRCWLHAASPAGGGAGGSREAACETLARRRAGFPDDWLIAYNLACYLCQMNRLDEADAMLAEARTMSGEKVEQLAADDEDLEPLRARAS